MQFRLTSLKPLCIIFFLSLSCTISSWYEILHFNWEYINTWAFILQRDILSLTYYHTILYAVDLKKKKKNQSFGPQLCKFFFTSFTRILVLVNLCFIALFSVKIMDLLQYLPNITRQVSLEMLCPLYWALFL